MNMKIEGTQPMAFDYLDEDSQLCILKYLPLKDRTRLERVNKNFQALIKSLWLQQKCLVFNSDLLRLRICSEKSHRMCRSDILANTDIETQLTIVRKCPNLIVLIMGYFARKGNEHTDSGKN